MGWTHADHADHWMVAVSSTPRTPAASREFCQVAAWACVAQHASSGVCLFLQGMFAMSFSCTVTELLSTRRQDLTANAPSSVPYSMILTQGRPDAHNINCLGNVTLDLKHVPCLRLGLACAAKPTSILQGNERVFSITNYCWSGRLSRWSLRRKQRQCVPPTPPPLLSSLWPL